MKLFFILGNQLFPTKYLDRFKKDHLFFMAEDKGLCTYEKHHKQKILLFLSSMRSYADGLRKNKFKLDYFKIEDKEFNDDYFKKLKKIITQKKVKEISSFEVEDKFFEKKISQFFKKEKINWNIIQTPMFLNSRAEFKNYLSKSKKPFMATFYKDVRKKSGNDIHLVGRNESELSSVSEKLGCSHTVVDVLEDGFIEKVKSDISEIKGLAYCVGSIDLTIKNGKRTRLSKMYET